MPVGLRSRVPAKMTSSILMPRRDFGGLLAEDPGDGVGDVGLAAAVGADDGGDAFAGELDLGAVAEGLEAEDLDFLELEQIRPLRRVPFGLGRPRLAFKTDSTVVAEEAGINGNNTTGCG